MTCESPRLVGMRRIEVLMARNLDMFYQNTLFTVSKGTTRKPGYPKTYAQKYLFDPESQRAPAHFHISKREDICCLAGGNILVQLRAAGPDERPSDERLVVKVDGIVRTTGAGVCNGVAGVGAARAIVPAPQVEALARRGQAVLLERILEAQT